MLQAVADWQQRTGYPLTFFTEASIDLADDPELMDLMVDANIISVFIGIESPNEESLIETKKYQNVREGRSMIEKVHAIQDEGLEVWCGMIIGFDHDDESIFDRQIAFLEEARIASGLVGMLHAIPRTPLYDRLQAEGRLGDAEGTGFRTNVIPLGMTREAMHEGYVRVLNTLYDPENYFRRLESLFIGAPDRHGPQPGPLLEAAPAQRAEDQRDVPGPRGRPVRPHDDGHPRPEAAARVPPPDRPPDPGPARSGHAADLHVQVRHALSRLYHGPEDDRQPGRGRQRLLTPFAQGSDAWKLLDLLKVEIESGDLRDAPEVGHVGVDDTRVFQLWADVPRARR